MAWSETPIFPGKVATRPAGTVASGSSTTLALATAATYGLVIDGPIVLHNVAAVARTFQIKLSNGGVATTIGRVTTSGSANQIINILSSTYIPGLDAVNPRLILAPNEILQIVPEDSGASAMSFTCLNVGTFEYPN